ncbi:peptidylprolyl isomerase [Paenimyroides ceti]
MAVLQKIREKSVLLIAVIGLSLFAFIIGGLLEGGINFSSRNVGTINGVDIATQDFLNKVQNAEKSGQAEGGQANNTVWNSEVRNILLSEQFDKAGLRLGKDQLINVIKNHPNFGQNPQFLNDAGVFDMGKFNAFVAQIKAAGGAQWYAWIDFEGQLEKFAKEQMYYNMIKSAVITTGLEAKYAYKKENDKATFDYVTVPYSTINDDEVKITDAEIESYIKKNEKQFKSENSRLVEYVFVENKPSAEDEKATKEKVSELLNSSVVFNAKTNKNDTIAGFRTNPDVIAFVNANSDVPYDSTYYAKADLPAEYQEQLYNLSAGEVFGPYLFNNHYCLSKLISKSVVTESVDASHILIAYTGAQSATPTVTLTKEQAKAKAEELLKQLQSNPALFADLASQNSTDPGSKDKGGKYENIPRGQMVPAFDQYIFNNPVGKLGIVETDFGFHVIKVDKKNEKEAVRLATVAKALEVSDKTEDEIYLKATKFEEGIATKDFSKLATELGLVAHPETKVGAFDDQLPGVGNQRQAIAWAYNKKTSVGDTKKFDSAEGHLIIKLVATNDSGLMSAVEARPTVEPILKNEKKAAIIRKKMTGATLEEVAKNAGVGVQTASDVNGVNTFLGAAPEPLVIGKALGSQPNQVSKLIDGNGGVFMIKARTVTKAPDLPNYNDYKSKVVNNNRNAVQGAVYNALYQNATIKDNRTSVLQ